MNVSIVNADSKYSRVPLEEPTSRGYIHIAAQTCEPSFPFRPNTDPRLLAELKDLVEHLEQVDCVDTIHTFRAVGLPPVSRLPYVKDHAGSIRIARFDVAVLIEMKNKESLAEVQGTPLYEALVEYLRTHSKSVHVMPAMNMKRFGEVNSTQDGLFLFNYFVAEDAATLMELWDYMADWYRVEMDLDNSLLLVPTNPEASDYVALNYARFEGSLPSFLAKQMPKRSFRNYLLANLDTHHVGAMPILYRLA
ncbi:hypothetical protein [Alicyclobacillus acidiphilus]|uniref:hypothetical protein n=1 Tax=Alicyclobacillus acidiphilus TaxID=182455 RepID=UPI00083363E7|nr:hypothetical protein [Alicyclobacillus acidiphilus]